jgi:predicted transcriptional regulator
MSELSGYEKEMQKRFFWSFNAPALVFGRMAAEIIIYEYDLDNMSQLEVIAMIKFLVKHHGYAHTYKLQALLSRDKFYMSKQLKRLKEKGLIDEYKFGLKKKYRLSKKANNIGQAWTYKTLNIFKEMEKIQKSNSTKFVSTPQGRKIMKVKK